MYTPRQQAGCNPRERPPDAAGYVAGGLCAGRMDAQGRLSAPPAPEQRDYDDLFSEEARQRGLPGELMRLARRHGCVRDRVLRATTDGGTCFQRIALRALYDDDGQLTGFQESLEGDG